MRRERFGNSLSKDSALALLMIEEKSAAHSAVRSPVAFHKEQIVCNRHNDVHEAAQHGQ